MKDWNRNLKGVKERVCIGCGRTWLVREKWGKESIHPRVFCDDCLQNLSKEKKQRLYREHSGEYHYEERECISCGEKWVVQVKNTYHQKRVKYFCEKCNATLSNKEKTRIQRAKLQGFHEKEKEQRRQSHQRTIIHVLWKRAYDRAKKFGYPFNITEEDIVIPDVCPILEVPFVFGSKGDYEYTPSLDRIVNSLGYVKGNIQVITKKANSMKNSATPEELKKFCKNILRYSLSSNEDEVTEQQDKEPVG